MRQGWIGRTDRHATRRRGPSNASTGNQGGPTRSRRCFPSSNRPAGADRAGAALLAARLAEGVAGIEYDDDRPDPGEYDIASAADAGVQGVPSSGQDKQRDA
ncbi:glycosidase [Bifidobacterium thermophilum]|nr:glycosidase [Bifidobacterium thermophilum]